MLTATIPAILSRPFVSKRRSPRCADGPACPLGARTTVESDIAACRSGAKKQKFDRTTKPRYRPGLCRLYGDVRSVLRDDRTAKAIIGANFHKVDVLPNI